MNEVTVAVLPHPVTMFIMGALVFSIVFIFLEFKRLVSEVKTFNILLQKVEERNEKMDANFEHKLEEVSRKVDSRVDKALMFPRKNQNK